MNSSTSYYAEPSDQGNTSQKSVELAVSIDSNRVDDMEYARDLAEKVLVHYPDAMDKDVISVDLYYGYDIGIWSSWDVGSYELICPVCRPGLPSGIALRDSPQGLP